MLAVLQRACYECVIDSWRHLTIVIEATSSHEFTHRANRFDATGSADERRHTSFLPDSELILDALAWAAQGDLIDEFIGYSGDRFVLFAGEVEVLNCLCRFLVTVPAGEVVVEVLSPRAHASDVQRQIRLHVHAASVYVIADYDADGWRDVEFVKCLSI